MLTPFSRVGQEPETPLVPPAPAMPAATPEDALAASVEDAPNHAGHASAGGPGPAPAKRVATRIRKADVTGRNGE